MSATESFLSQIPHEAVKEITDQLDDFENLIDPLIIYPLEETLSDLTVLQQGRMNTLVPLLLARLTKGECSNSFPQVFHWCFSWSG